MPKKNRNRKGFNAKIESETRSIVVPFRRLLVNTFGVTNVSTLDLQVPSNVLGTRITNVGDNYLHWRFKRLRVTSVLSGGGVTTAEQFGAGPTTVYNANGVIQMIAFSMGDTTKLSGIPTTAQASQMPCFALGNGFQRISFNVPPRVLQRDGAVPWYETQTRGSESEAFRIPGFLWYSSVVEHTVNGDLSQQIMIEGDIEFRDPVDSVLSFMDKPKNVPPADDDEKSCDRDDESDFAEFLVWKRHQKGLSKALMDDTRK